MGAPMRHDDVLGRDINLNLGRLLQPSRNEPTYGRLCLLLGGGRECLLELIVSSDFMLSLFVAFQVLFNQAYHVSLMLLETSTQTGVLSVL